MKRYTVLFSLLVFLFAGCDDAKQYLPKTGLTEAEIAAGLREALSVGTDTTVKIVSKVNGYFQDAAIKLLLPAEAQSVISTLRSSGSGVGETIYQNSIKTLEDKLIQSLNYAAEDAAKTAAPILKNAITGMSITDATNILYGTDTAATNFLRKNTFTQLITAYSPKIDTSLNKPLLLGNSANYYWNSYVTAYNGVVDIQNITPFGLTNLTKISNTSLGAYATDRALTGLFVKVKDEEKLIRKDPLKRVTDILQKVFGELDKK